jgi:hypothetical protein
MGKSLTLNLYMGKEFKMAKDNKTVDRIQAVWNILGGEEGVDRLINREVLGRNVFMNPILCLLSRGVNIIIGKCDSAQFFTQANAVFEGGADVKFCSWGLVQQQKVETDEIAVAVYEQVNDATCSEMFCSLGTKLNKLCLTPPQIVAFCKSNSNWLRGDGYATFFLFKEKGEFFVASVNVISNDMRVSVNFLGNDREWDAEGQRHLVVPALK